MLVIGDYKHLEWDTCVFQAQDTVAMKELWDGGDMHSDNQQKFGLPSRHIAKIFLFRLIFGGTGPAYAYDPEFSFVSDKPKFWNDVIDSFYLKYPGINDWHRKLMYEAMDTGRVTIPTGRFFPFQPYLKRGEWVWPRTKILNYPVQGLGAELMVIARVVMRAKMRQAGLKGVMVCTVHDSILVDCPNEEVDEVVRCFFETWKELPEWFAKKYGIVYNLPCLVEVKKGPNWANMEEVHAN